MTGIGRVLVIVYAVMALAATGRSFVQIVERFDEAPLAYTLSALAAVVYIVATLALVFAGSRAWYRVAWVAIVFELIGVLVVGSLTFVLPDLFAHPTVWSWFGIGYLFVPLVLPFFGLWWLRTHRPASQSAAPTHRSAVAPMIVFRDPAEVPAGFGALGRRDRQVRRRARRATAPSWTGRPGGCRDRRTHAWSRSRSTATRSRCCARISAPTT